MVASFFLPLPHGNLQGLPTDDKGFRVLSKRVTVIDFTVTIKGLEGQLLAKVVLQEKPELEYERTKLQVEVNGYQKKRVELHDDLLYCLSSCGGSLRMIRRLSMC